MITLTDEKGQDWIFTEEDLPEEVSRAFKYIGLGKGELRIWRDHVFSDFLSSPDTDETLSRLRETIEDAKATSLLVGELDVLQKQDELIDHALRSHFTTGALATRLDRVSDSNE